MSGVADELGPVLPSRVATHVLAGDLVRCAQRARELSGSGPGADLRRALAEFDRMRALLGPGRGDEQEGGDHG